MACSEATRDCSPPTGELWIDPVDGVHWSAPEVFAEQFVDAMRALVALRAYRACVFAAPGETLPKWLARHHPNYPAAWRDLDSEHTPEVTFEQLETNCLPVLFVASQEHELPLCGNVAKPTNRGEAA